MTFLIALGAIALVLLLLGLISIWIAVRSIDPGNWNW